jgi:hypothetical protein
MAKAPSAHTTPGIPRAPEARRVLYLELPLRAKPSTFAAVSPTAAVRARRASGRGERRAAALARVGAGRYIKPAAQPLETRVNVAPAASVVAVRVEAERKDDRECGKEPADGPSDLLTGMCGQW